MTLKTSPAIPILMYHQVCKAPPRGTPMRGMCVSPGAFARQMAALRWLGFRGLAMHELQPYLEGAKQGKVLGLTFDDGYANNFFNALPILQRAGFSATCYAVSSAIGGHNDWDAVLGVPRQPLMTDAQWRGWRDAGMEIGAHGRAHVNLTTLEPSAARAEIDGCKRDLEARFDVKVEHFCYPYGRYEERHVQWVRAAGYRSATTVRRGRSRPGDDPFTLPRVLVANSTDPLRFVLKLLTAYEDRRG